MPDVKEALRKTASTARVTVQDRLARLASGAKDAGKPIGQKKGASDRKTFFLPATDLELLTALRRRSRFSERDFNSSEVIRAAIRHLACLDDAALRRKLEAVERLVPGKKPH